MKTSLPRITFFLAASVWSLSAQNAAADSPSLQTLMQKAQQYQKSGDLDSAVRQYHAFLSSALQELAIGHAQLGDYPRAKSLFEDALLLTPADANLRRNYAFAAISAEDLDKAESLARWLLNNQKADIRQRARDHQFLGRVLLRMNRDSEARKEMEAAVALQPLFEHVYSLAVVCLDMDEEKCAVDNFQKIQDSLGESAELHMQFGRAYGNSDSAPRAVDEFRRALAMNPKLRGAHYSLAAALLSAGEDPQRVHEAEVELKKELELQPHDAMSYAALGKLEANRHQNEEAEKDLKKAIEIDPHSPDAYLSIGQLFYDLARFDEAAEAFRNAIRYTSDPSLNRYQIQKAHFLLGRILVQQHHEEEAREEMKIARVLANKVLSRDKKQLAGMLTGGLGSGVATNNSRENQSFSTVATTKDPEAASAQQTFEKQLAPAIADSYNNLGAITAERGDYIGALTDFQHAATWNPSLDDLDYNLGRAAFMAAKFAQAIAPLARQYHLHPSDEGLRNALGLSQFMAGDYAGCVTTLHSGESALAAIPQMQYAYAVSLVKSGNLTEGIKLLETMAASQPDVADLHRELGEAYQQRGDLRKALLQFQIAQRLNPNDAQANYQLGVAELKAGNSSAAMISLQTAVRLAPHEIEYHRQLAQAYDAAFRLGDAQRERSKIETLQNEK